MNKKFILGIAAATVLAASSVLSASAAGFAKKNTYTPGMFADVPATEWYASSVSSSYELGFMNGTAAGVFSPNGEMTVAEAITVASRVHDTYNSKGTTFAADGANWYDAYVSYAEANGIIEKGEYAASDFDRPVKRYEMAVIFSKAVPDEYLGAKNNVAKIPDVPETNAYFDRLQLLYNAGVVMGNDAYGTFKPNNNIIRAEAAAIIGRIALPENRLTKSLVDADYEDAYYLINHVTGTTLSPSSSYSDSPWFYDNRGRVGAISNTADNISDYYEDLQMEIWRDIEDVDCGLLGFDFLGEIVGEDGLYINVTDDDRNAVWSLTVKSGNFHFNGIDTGVKVEGRTQYITVKANMDTDTSEIYINGKKIGNTYPSGNYVASRIYLGSGKETTGTIVVQRLDLYRNYVANDIFLVPTGSELAQWTLTGGTGEVAEVGGQSYNDTRSAKISQGTTAKQVFSKPISGKVVFETYMLAPTAADTGVVSLNSGDASVAKLNVTADGVFKADGTKLRHHTNNIWQCLRIEADTTTGTVLYKINGKKVGEYALDSAVQTVDNITVTATGGTIFFDDVEVYLTHEYDDYCPTPVPITDDGYDVVLNICSLWREGQHFGWGAINAHEDIEPVLGYYDEGIPEVADWEIKMWVENGIDVAHFCWYSPSENITTPIKKSGMNDALHDGFFNAKYSDMMKFTFMWENASTNAYSLDQFKKYIWAYWMDYYFLDDRFYTPDNMLTFTVWDYRNFRTTFGDTVEGCLEAVNFMNEDAKAHGFDGVRIWFADQHAIDASTFAAMAEIGGTAAYAYHWNQDGIYADKTIPRLLKNQNHGKIHIVPTVSVGFNNIGWSGVRKPLASLKDHRQVLEYIKDTYLTKELGWKSNTLIVSTWNEYGEGTYVMPVMGLHGFGYLENVAEVISGVTDHSNNILPTEQQKARLAHLYPKSKTSIVKTDYEAASTSAPTKIVSEYTGDDLVVSHGVDTNSVFVFDGVFKANAATSDPALLISNEKFKAVKADEVDAIAVTMRTSVQSNLEVFFTTEEDPNLNQAKAFSAKLTPSEEFVTYVIYTDTNKFWAGNIVSMRIDPIFATNTFEIKNVQLLARESDKMPVSITIDGTLYEGPFTSIHDDNGELYVAADAVKGFFSLHNFYYEWSRFTGKLRIVAKNDCEVIFTVDSDIALVNGKETKLAKAFTLRDGLPVIPLYFMYEAAGITYELKDNAITVSTLSPKDQEIVKNRKPYQYEFEVTGDIEGLKPSDTTVSAYKGALHGVAVERTNSNPRYDPRFSIYGLDINTLECEKVYVAMKHQLEPGRESAAVQLFFTTNSQSGLSESKSKVLRIEGNSSDDYVVYEFDFSDNENWTGKVTSVRFDPFSCGGSFEIDYIRFFIDDELREKNQAIIDQQEKEALERIEKGIIVINGDAEDLNNPKAFIGSAGNAVVTIAQDEEKGNVWKVIPDSKSQVWTSANQGTWYQPGSSYSVVCDVKLLGYNDSDEEVSSTIICNIVYQGSDGTVDHLVERRCQISTKDGWKTYNFQFTIPGDLSDHSKDTFRLYSNPTNGKGVGFMFDNIVVTKKN